MLHRIRGVPGRSGGDVYFDDKKLSLDHSLTIVYHSPTGFNWGYAGSGPAQLALALLLAITEDPQFSLRNHQDFKRDYVARWPFNEPFEDEVDFRGWLKDHGWTDDKTN